MSTQRGSLPMPNASPTTAGSTGRHAQGPGSGSGSGSGLGRGAGKAGPPKRRRRWLRRCRRTLIVAVVLLAAAYLVLTRTGVASLVVLPAIGDRLGGELSAADVRFSPSGHLLLRDVTLRAPGLDGPAGELLRADALDVTLDLPALARGEVTITNLLALRPQLRVGVGPGGEFNVLLLRRDAGPAAAMPALPDVQVVDAQVDLVEYGPGFFEELATMRVRGGLTPKAGTSGYAVELTQIEESSAGPRGTGSGSGDGAAELGGRLVLRGSLDPDRGTAELRLTGVDLSEWAERTAPRDYRALWRTMDVRGRIPSAVFTTGPEAGSSFELTLAGVDMNIPIAPMRAPEAGDAADAARDAANETIAMRDVSGTMTFTARGLIAKLRGSIEELDARVTLDFRGRTLDAPFVATIDVERFEMTPDTRLLSVAPPMVSKILDRFPNTSGVVGGEVTIRKLPVQGADDPEAVKVSAVGTISITDATTRYHEYPYPFEDVSGTVRFDADGVYIEEFRGVSASGASLRASGHVIPPGDGAEVDIRVRVTDTPIDERFVGSMPSDRRAIVEGVFSEPMHDRLIERGLVLGVAERSALLEAQIAARTALDDVLDSDEGSAVEAERLRDELTRIAAELDRPVFEPGGEVDLDIRVFRPLGDDSRYATTIDAVVHDARLLPAGFPLPMSAERAVLRITSARTSVEPMALRVPGAGEGTLTVRGEVLHPQGEDGGGEGGGVTPDLDVEIAGLPLNELLLAAIEESDAGAGRGGEGGAEVERVAATLRRLRPAVTLAGSARLEPRAGGGEAGDRLDVYADVSFADGEASPRAAGRELRISGLTGAVSITPASVTVPELRGRFEHARGAGRAGEDEAEPGSAFTVSASVQTETGDAEAVFAAPELDLSLPIDALLAALSPEGAAAAARALREASPTGRARVSGALARDGEGGGPEPALSYDVELAPIDGVALTVLGDRLETSEARGLVRLTPGRVAAEELAATLRFGGVDSGRAVLDGAVALGDDIADGGEAGENGVGARLRVELLGGEAASPLVRSLAGRFAPPARAWLDEHAAAGAFDATANVLTGGGRDAAGGPGAGFSGEVRPRSFAMTRNGERIELPRASGRITAERTATGVSGVVDVSGASEPLQGRFVGEWSARAEAGPMDAALEIRGTLDGGASSLSPAVRALLPEAARAALEAVEMTSDASVDVEDAQVYLAVAGGEGRETAAGDAGTAAGATGEGDRIGGRFLGMVRFESLDVKPGFPVRDVAGVASVSVEAPIGAAPEVDIAVRGERAEIAGITFGDVAAKLASGQTPGTFVMPLAEASAHGGKLTAKAAYRPADPTGPHPAHASWRLEASLFEIDFGAALRDIAAEPDEDLDTTAPTDRGLMSANLTLEGYVGLPEATRGRGIVRVQQADESSGTEVLQLKGLMGLIRLSSLRAPQDEPVTFAWADFSVDGSTARFRELEAVSESESIIIKGAGTMSWPGLDLDLTFAPMTREKGGPLGEVLRGLRDELVTARVTGSLYDPSVSYEQLSETRQLLRAIIEGDRSEAEDAAGGGSGSGSGREGSVEGGG